MSKRLADNAQVTSTVAALGLLLYIMSVQTQNSIGIYLGAFDFLVFVPITVRNLQRH